MKRENAVLLLCWIVIIGWVLMLGCIKPLTWNGAVYQCPQELLEKVDKDLTEVKEACQQQKTK